MSANLHAEPVARSPAALAHLHMTRRLRTLFTGSSERDHTQRGALLAFLVRVISAGILYLSQIILARWMGAFEYGIYVFVWTWVLVLGGLSNLGISTLMMRRLPEYGARGEHDLLRGLLLMGRAMALGASTLVTLAALLILALLGDRVAGPYTLPVLLTLACVPVITLSDVQDGIGRAKGWMSVALVPPYVLRPLLVLLAMAVAHLAGLEMSAVTAAGAAIVATWVSSVIQTVLLERRLAREVPSGPRQYAPTAWIAMSLPLLVTSGSELLLQNTDVLIVSRFLTPADVGLYFAAAKTMSLIMFVHYAVGSAMAKRFAALDARGEQAALAGLTREAVGWTFWPSLVIAVGLLALGRPLLSLFGAQFTAAYPVMAILALGFLARAATGPSELILSMLGEHRAAAIILGSVAVLNIILNLALVPVLGLNGAALATSLSLVALSIGNAHYAKRRLGLKLGIWSQLRAT